MDVNMVVESFRELMFNGMVILSVPLIASFVVAIIVGIIQAVTQIQEQTLSFVPKLVALIAVFYVMGPWMIEKILILYKDYLHNIPNML